MAIIHLTRGYLATVDEADAHLAGFKWRASINRSGVVYAKRSLPTAEGGGCVYLHRAVLDAAPGEVVDHLDGDGLNNRRGNLKRCSQAVNMMNVAGAKRNSQSGILGVRYIARINRWDARIRTGAGKRVLLGYFETAEAANFARLLAEREYLGVLPQRRAAFEAAGLA